MPLAAILFADPPGDWATPALRLGGLTIVERQSRLARRAGAVRVLVVGGVDGGAGAVAAALGDATNVLVFDPGVVVDDRVVRAVVRASAVATWPAGQASRAGVERIDAVSTAAGIGAYPSALVRDIAAGLGDWDFAATLRRAALAGGAARIDLAALAPDTPSIWARPDDPDAAAAATAALVAAARTDDPDWVARWIDRPVVGIAVPALLATPVPSAAVAVAAAIVAVAAGVAFATGSLWPGLLLALVYGPLAKIAATTAAVRLEGARIVALARRADPAVETIWVLAAAAHFAAPGFGAPGVGPWALVALLLGAGFADRRQAAFFRRVTGQRLADAGRVERRLARVAAGRATLVWAWLPFAAAGLWLPGFAVLAGYRSLSFLVAQDRAFRRLAADAAKRYPTVGRSV